MSDARPTLTTTDTDPTFRGPPAPGPALYGRRPVGDTEEAVPPGYGDLAWAPTTDAVPDLERVLRARMRRAPKSSSTRAARDLGWLLPKGKMDERFVPASREGVKDVRWFTPEEACRVVTHTSLRPLMLRARDLVENDGLRGR